MNTDNVYGILKNKGYLRFRRGGITDAVGEVGQAYGTIDNYRLANTVVGESSIAISGIAGKSGDVAAVHNTVYIEYMDQMATKGMLTAPGYIYTDGFAGCVFYLYKGAAGTVWGVHASRASGRLADPTPWATGQGYKELYKWDSLGTLPDAKRMQGFNGAVFACVDHDRIVVFSLAMKNEQVMDISNVGDLKNWKS